ncbi:MAG TPA: acyltransferase, partial [Actinomycetota bacterium]|nr:acyltransferase [Actinomycetota bacterium]
MRDAGDRRDRVAALDGLRGLAVVAVLAFHAAPEVFRGGFLGVEMFFVLSGFLLGSLLLAEHARTGRIDMIGYARRRALRIGPGLLVFLAGLAVLAPALAPDDVHRLPGDIAWSVVGLTNWHLVAEGASYFERVGRPPFVGHLWSIAIELQFYVICPLLLAWLARRRVRTALAALGAGVAASAFAMSVHARPDAYFRTDARIGALLTGVAVAIAVTRADRLPDWVRRLAPAGLAALAVALAFGHHGSRLLYPAGFLAVQAATGAVLLAVGAGGSAGPALGARWLRWLGRRSYGIYLWHWPLVIVMRPGIDVTWPAPVSVVVGVAGAVALGAASYRFVEGPLISGRLPWPPRVAAGAAAACVALIASVAVHVPAEDPIVASLRAGEQALA